MKGDHMKGLATGLIAGCIPLIVFLVIKSRSEAFKEDFELQQLDERLKNNKRRAMAVAGIVMVIANFIMVIASNWIEIEFRIAGTILVWIYVIALFITKLIYKNK